LWRNDLSSENHLAWLRHACYVFSPFVNPPYHIALCCNGTMLPGLHATLGSLVKRLGQREKVSLTVFVQDITEAELTEVRGTINDAGGVGALNFNEADPSEFKDLKTLHGEWMTYLRLLLPRLLPDAGTILYLDSDLVIDMDACAFFDHDLSNSALGAIDGAAVEWTLDRDFLKLVGLTDTDRTFNAGILLINVKLWNQNGLVNRALEIARTHSEVLTSHDQSVLNAMFSREFYKLPPQYNLAVTPEDKLVPRTDCIYHFVGSPKPWDPFGKYFHGSWPIWHSVIAQTKFRWSHFLSHHLSAYCKRGWMLRRSYVRTLRKR
jgi:lipopolysaccharide biosynthesis glycosyltransferase